LLATTIRSASCRRSSPVAALRFSPLPLAALEGHLRYIAEPGQIGITPEALQVGWRNGPREG